MHAIEKRIVELRQYEPQLVKPDGFEAYWEQIRQEALAESFDAIRKPAATLMQGVASYEVVYEGFAGTSIHATLSIPANRSDEQHYPCLISLPGYTSERSNSYQHAHWLLMGVAVMSIDVRGQGRETGNSLGSSHGMTRGWITEGLLELERCYYKAVAVDMLRGLHWLKAQPEIDAARIGVIGASQGGGLASLLAAQDRDIALLVADIPNMCHIDYGVMHSTGSLTEVAEFCRRSPELLDQVLGNLSYFDLLHMAERIKMPVLMSVGLKDTVCTPEQIFPFFKQIASPQKQLEIYPFSGHVVERAQEQKAISFVHQHLGQASR